jgi:hypothetical protein
MSASPPSTLVTSPLCVTVATEASEDCHIDWDVTPCVVPFESVAVAVN